MAGIHHRLPRFVALAALLVYGLTLSWGTTLNSLPMAAKVAGWDWQPMANEPLTWLLTLPLRCLPAGWIPVSLNLFFAICGALTLGLLARSIELLPWDCPPDENKKWIKRLPVLLACAVCGLEFNFWQEATAGGGLLVPAGISRRQGIALAEDGGVDLGSGHGGELDDAAQPAIVCGGVDLGASA